MGPRTTIVFPPAADPSLPYGALPLLGACLKRAGYPEVALRDLNLEAFEDLLAPAALRGAANRLPRTPAWADQAVAGIDEAMRILRDPDEFYRPERLLFAKYVFGLAGTLVTASHPGLRFGKYTYSSSGYDSYADIDRAVTADAGPLGDWLHATAVPSLLAWRPDVIGISVPYFSQLIPAFLLAEAVRAADPRVHLCFGGPVVTWGREVLTADPRFGRWLDSFVVGEGDDVLPQLIEAIDGKRDIDEIPNLVRYVDGRVVGRLRPDVHPDLDGLPTPDFTMLPMDRYLAPDKIICLVPTRGCYYNKCAFCNYSFIKLTPYRMRSPALIAEDVAAIKAATGQDVFSFETDVILPKDLGAISDALLRRGTAITWHGVARFEKGFTPELMRTMRDAGCVRLYLGLESANDRTLAAMRKGADSARISAILRLCHDAGIAVEAGVFSGFPSETPDEADETYRFIRDHADVISRADAGTFRLLKGSPIADEPERYGITVLDDPSRRWYHLSYAEDTGTRPDTVMARLQKLYPQATLIDVAEDILYTARRGPDALRRFFHEPPVAAAPHDALTDDATIAVPDGCEVRRMTVTNSGAVHLDVLAVDEATPLFETSAFSIAVMVDRGRAAIRPLGEAEEHLLHMLGPTGSPLHALRAGWAAADVPGTLTEVLTNLLATGMVTSTAAADPTIG